MPKSGLRKAETGPGSPDRAKAGLIQGHRAGWKQGLRPRAQITEIRAVAQKPAQHSGPGVEAQVEKRGGSQES